MDQIELILNADDRGDLLRFGDLLRGHVAEPDVADQPALLQTGQRLDLPGDRAFAGLMDVAHDAQIDHIHRLEPEIAQIILDSAGQIVRFLRRQPGRIGPSHGADLGDDGQILGVRMQRFLDDLVGDMRAVEIAGVDMVDALGDSLAQHGEGGVAILGRTEDAGTGQLHGAITHAVHGAAGEGKGGSDRHDNLLKSMRLVSLDRDCFIIRYNLHDLFG